MISKKEIEKVLHSDFINVLNQRTIYKYSDFNPAYDKILIANTLKFSNPLEFNDPFDCHEQLLNVQTSDRVIAETPSISTMAKSMIRREKRELIRNVKKGSNNASIFKSERMKYKITCFSTKKDEVLMWSHYANKHRGICVGFYFPPVVENKFALYPVRYLDSIVPIDGETDIERTMIYWLTTKSERWHYEEEIRAIFNSKKTETIEIIDFECNYIKEVIFGCKVPISLIHKTIKGIKRAHPYYSKVKFTRMIINPKTFLLMEEIIKY